MKTRTIFEHCYQKINIASGLTFHSAIKQVYTASLESLISASTTKKLQGKVMVAV